MVQYRRNYVEGGTYFFTVVLRDRRSTVLVDYIGPLRDAFRYVRHQRPFTIDAVVVMPDHIHTIWTLPLNDTDYAGRWRAIKSRFTRRLVRLGVPLMRNAKGEYDLWQRRYWEHTIRDNNDMARHVDYIHYNPVKHGHVASVSDWPYSSFHRFVDADLYPIDWGTGEMDFEGVGNE